MTTISISATCLLIVVCLACAQQRVADCSALPSSSSSAISSPEDQLQLQSSNLVHSEQDKSVSNGKKLKQHFREQQQQQQKSKLALKRKWHAIVDDLIDSVASSSTTAAPSEEGEKFAVNKPLARKRQLLFNTVQQQQQDEQPEDSKLMIVVKRKPMMPLDDTLKLTPLMSLNVLNDQQQQQPQQPQQQQQQQQHDKPHSMAEHQRRILDDVAGIRRDSIWTTNNHLGQKGVPKFGSEEQF